MANSNPSHATRFKKGEIRNPGGKTTMQKRKEISNAEKSVVIRERILDALLKQIDDLDGDDERLEMALSQLNPNVLKMLKDSEDRGLGSPVQAVFTEKLEPEPTIDMTKLSMGALEEIEKAWLEK